ncbi:hypothetical protein ACQP2K_24420 [Microbispora siamensis]
MRLRGAIAIAPGGWGYSQTVAYLQAMPGAKDALAFLPTILFGAAAADPAIKPDELVTDGVKPLLDAARTGCMDQVRAVAADTRTYAGADHRGSVSASFEDALAFARTILAGGTPSSTC